MRKKRIITDDIDLSSKLITTDDEFYSSKKTSDSTSQFSEAYKGASRFFALLSTSDKVINSRVYDKTSWKKTVVDGSWTGPMYAKPMIRNHDIRSQVPFGRIKDSYFVEHGSNEVTHKDGKTIDKKVLDFYKNAGALGEGSGSVIVEFSSDEATASRMIAGLDVTVSQSSYFKEANCSICGQDYFGGECTHMAGRTYQIKKDDVTVDLDCVVMTKDFDPIELSIVNTPANDTSVIFVLTNPSSSSNDSTEEFSSDKTEGGIDDSENTCQDNANDKTNLMEDKDKMFKKMLKDTLIAGIKKDIADNAELLEAFGAIFDASNEEQIPLVKTLVDEFAKVLETAKLEATNDSSEESAVEESEDAAQQEVVAATEEVAEEPKSEDSEIEAEEVKPEEIEEQVKDALGVVKKEKVSKDNRILNTIINGLKL
ncbi:MAG: hypothetical protein ACRCX2_37040 [Paraclostridium sp.]